MWVLSVLMLAAVAAGAGAGQLSDEEYHSMPRLFHADHYERCLARPRGLYCMGSFRLSPAAAPHRLYDVMKGYSMDRNHFDRTLLHRGYCVSSRCPRAAANLTSDAENVQRFEACVSRWAGGLRLRARLQRLAYCRSARSSRIDELAAAREDSPHQLLLQVVTAILVLNVVGTVYDFVLGDDVKKNAFLTMWSLRSNWRRLVASYDGGDERLATLAPLQGYRVLLLAIVIVAHAGTIHHMLYLHNPEFLEQMSAHPLIVVVQNGASIVQTFVMLSSFLMAYNLLLFAQKSQRPISFAMVPKIILYRVFRLAPMSLLVVGFAATWWPRMRDGAQWQAVVAREAAICKDKFWAHALFVNNFVEPDRHCLLQTWFLAVDMQLHAACALLLAGLGWRRVARPERALAAMFLAACAANGLLAHVFNWKSLLFIMKPEAIRTQFAGIASFPRLYTSPWGSLPAALLGLLLAHVLHRAAPPALPRVLSRWPGLLSLVPLAWVLLHVWLRGARRGAALLSAADRPVFALACTLPVYAVCRRLPSSTHRFFAWHGWRVLARLSLAALLLHWPLDMLRAAAAPAQHASMFDIFADGLATWCFTYLLAVPLTLMVEMPFNRLGAALM